MTGTMTTVSLNKAPSVTQGGATELFGTKMAPKQGRLLIFPSTWVHMHRGGVPNSNDKYIVIGWLMSNIKP